MTRAGEHRGAAWWCGMVAGWLVASFGVWTLASGRDGLRGAVDVGVWVAAGHALHDLVVLPAAALVGVALARLAPRQTRAALRAGLFASVVAVAVAYPALRGFGRRPDNPSVLPLDYRSAVLTVVGVVWGLVAIWIALGVLRRARTAEGGPGR